MTIKCHTVRFTAVLVLLSVLLALLPVAVSADESTPAAYAEPTLLRADDFSEAVGGFRLYADNPDGHALQLGYAIYKSTDLQTPLTIPEGWVTVTQIEPPATDGDDAAIAAYPVFALDFHKPGEITVEDPAYIESPAFLRAVYVSGAPVYTLAPGYTAAFRITGGTPDESGAYPFDHTVQYTGDAPIVTYTLERPSKIVGQLTQEEGKSGSLAIDVMNPASVRYLWSAINEDAPGLLSAGGMTDIRLCIQYDFTRMDVPSAYDEEADDTITELWSPETLIPIAIGSNPDLCHHVDFGRHEKFTADFSDETFRARFPEGTFTEVTAEPAEDGADAQTYYTIDAENVALSTRARYVLVQTAADGTVYYSKSAFTDPFYCGASNSLVADPTVINAPTLSDPAFVTADNGDTTLTFAVTSDDTVRDTVFWTCAFGRGTVGYALEISVNGGEWAPFGGTVNAALIPGTDSTMSVTVPADQLSEYAYIRIRMRYTADEIPLQSEWSAALAFDIKPEEIVTAPSTEITVPLYTETTGGEGELRYVCPICGFCPAPYGVCLFLWLGAALLIVLLIVLIIALIPKKKYCPRCTAACRPQDKSCTTCGYRFVGSMPEIEDTTGEITLPRQTTAEEEDAFFDDALRDGQKTPRVMAVNILDDDDTPEAAAPAGPEPESAPAPTPAKEEPKPESPAPKSAPAPSSAPNAAFLYELKRKMAAVKAGQKVSFTPEEIAYIKALKDKAAPKPAPVQTPVQKPAQTTAPASAPAPKADANSDTREIPVAPIKVTPAAEDDEAAREAQLAREAQIARLRALRAKQLSAEDTAELEKTEKKDEIPAQPRRVEKPAKQIKCPACAVPNPETSGQCYICGTRLK